jgi:cellulose synthase/poly-beta-1,6-N-acetylglucosamine synthase-like glycosyltransferase
VFSIASLFYKQKIYADNGNKKIAVLIPGYKEDGVIIEVATLALQQEYPSNLYDVVIIADSFKRDNRCTKYFTNKSN